MDKLPETGRWCHCFAAIFRLWTSLAHQKMLMKKSRYVLWRNNRCDIWDVCCVVFPQILLRYGRHPNIIELRDVSWLNWCVCASIVSVSPIDHMTVTWPVLLHCRCTTMGSRCTWWWNWWRAGNSSTGYSTRSSSLRGRQPMFYSSW